MNSLAPHPYIAIYKADTTTELELPLILNKISAGFPSPALDYMVTGVDLNKKLIRNKDATFYIQVQGDSMKDAGIGDDDFLIVDRSLHAGQGSVVLVSVNGENTVKRLHRVGKETFLLPANPSYPDLHVTNEMDMRIFGVVTYAIKTIK